jgi:hypothetical protein
MALFSPKSGPNYSQILLQNMNNSQQPQTEENKQTKIVKQKAENAKKNADGLLLYNIRKDLTVHRDILAQFMKAAQKKCDSVDRKLNSSSWRLKHGSRPNKANLIENRRANAKVLRLLKTADASLAAFYNKYYEPTLLSFWKKEYDIQDIKNAYIKELVKLRNTGIHHLKYEENHKDFVGGSHKLKTTYNNIISQYPDRKIPDSIDNFEEILQEKTAEFIAENYHDDFNCFINKANFKLNFWKRIQKETEIELKNAPAKNKEIIQAAVNRATNNVKALENLQDNLESFRIDSNYKIVTKDYVNIHNNYINIIKLFYNCKLEYSNKLNPEEVISKGIDIYKEPGSHKIMYDPKFFDNLFPTQKKNDNNYHNNKKLNLVVDNNINSCNISGHEDLKNDFTNLLNNSVHNNGDNDVKYTSLDNKKLMPPPVTKAILNFSDEKDDQEQFKNKFLSAIQRSLNSEKLEMRKKEMNLQSQYRENSNKLNSFFWRLFHGSKKIEKVKENMRELKKKLISIVKAEYFLNSYKLKHFKNSSNNTDLERVVQEYFELDVKVSKEGHKLAILKKTIEPEVENYNKIRLEYVKHLNKNSQQINYENDDVEFIGNNADEDEKFSTISTTINPPESTSQVNDFTVEEMKILNEIVDETEIVIGSDVEENMELFHQ